MNSRDVSALALEDEKINITPEMIESGRRKVHAAGWGATRYPFATQLVSTKR